MQRVERWRSCMRRACSSSPTTSFNPYEGLGHEALAHLLPENRALTLAAAANSYRAFLDRAPSDNPYRVSAQSNLAAVEAALNSARAERKGIP